MKNWLKMLVLIGFLMTVAIVGLVIMFEPASREREPEPAHVRTDDELLNNQLRSDKLTPVEAINNYVSCAKNEGTCDIRMFTADVSAVRQKLGSEKMDSLDIRTSGDPVAAGKLKGGVKIDQSIFDAFDSNLLIHDEPSVIKGLGLVVKSSSVTFYGERLSRVRTVLVNDTESYFRFNDFFLYRTESGVWKIFRVLPSDD